MTRCPQCDRENPLGLAKCQICGATLPSAAVADEDPAAADERDLERELVGLLKGGHKIEAIKVYRERRDVGLKEAKDAVEALAARQGIVASQPAGCLSVLLLAVIVASWPTIWETLSGACGAAGARGQDAERPQAVLAVTKDASGILTHTITSEYQAGPTEIRVLLPDRLQPDRRYPVVYVLPVEARQEDRWGNGLLEIHKHDLHNQHQAIFVAPTFSHLPWYADHPTHAELRQETYFLKVVVPWVEKQYPVQATPDGRLLLGFSKSGYGAFSLLLRHPDLFGRAAAWDAPVTMAQPNRYGMGEIYGTQQNFEHYQITKLLEDRVGDLRGPPRLFLLGYGNFRDQHEQAHALMVRLGVPHHYEDGPPRPHHWNSGWVPPAVQLLLPAAPDSTQKPAP